MKIFERRERARQLLERLDVSGHIIWPDGEGRVRIRPKPKLGDRLDLLEVRDEVRVLVNERDREAALLHESVGVVGVSPWLAEGDRVLKVASLKDDRLRREISEQEARAFAKQLAALVNLIREARWALAGFCVRTRRTGPPPDAAEQAWLEYRLKIWEEPRSIEECEVRIATIEAKIVELEASKVGAS